MPTPKVGSSQGDGHGLATPAAGRADLTGGPVPICRQPPLHRSGTSRMSDAVDRLLGSDPGFVRLLTAVQGVVTIGLAMLAESQFVRLTHALQIDPVSAGLPASIVAAQHHGILVVAILLGAVMGMMASFSAASFPTPRSLLASLALMPIPMVAGLALGVVLAPYRLLALTSFVALLAAGAHFRRFGPRGFVGGMLLFMGDFFGFFLHGEVTTKDLPWLAAEIVVAILITIVVQFTLFYPHRRVALRRMQRSYLVRAREVATAALKLLEDDGNRVRASRRLHRALVRLNEAALIIDAQLAQPTAIPAGWSGAALHQKLFDAELALTNVARFAEQFGRMDLLPSVRGLVRTALSGIAFQDVAGAERAAHDLLAEIVIRHEATASTGPADRTTRIVLHRFAVSTLGYTEAVRRRPTAPAGGQEVFQPSVELFGGWLPGSMEVSAAASLELGPTTSTSSLLSRLRLGDRIRLAPYNRVAIQMGVAVTGAIILGDLLSDRRFYWAVIATFVTFMGANNSGEQVRKGALRILGTVLGVLLGGFLAHLVGQRSDLAITVILTALFLGLYLMRVNYAFFVIGMTVMVSQMYVQLDEFTNSLLLLRLEETAIGASVTVLTVMFVFPLRTARVARVASLAYVQALTEVAEQGICLLTGRPECTAGEDPRAASRRLDAVYQSLVVTIIPLRYSFVRSTGTNRERFLTSVTASRHYARNLLADASSAGQLPDEALGDLISAGQLLSESIGQIARTLEDHHRSERTYLRSASRFDLVATALADQSYTAPAQLALRDLQLLDGAMATLAASADMAVLALDTTAS